MRVRKKKNGQARLAACADLMLPKDVMSEDELHRIFGNKNPVRLEIGCGKGSFILNTAIQNPDVNFIAMEKISDVMVNCAERIKASGVSNIRLLIADAADLDCHFQDDIFETIYLNFSDPWPKSGYYKRRLTYRSFLDKYKKIMKKSGALLFKTDNRSFFDFSLEEMKESGFRLMNITYDLHNSAFAGENIMTEYEINFADKGFPIHRVEAYIQ